MYFNIYLSARIGAEAMGVYSLIGSVYGFGVTLATSGINLAATRMVSEAQGKGTRRIMGTCIAYSLIFGTASMIGIFSLSEIIAYRFLEDARTAVSLRILSLSLPFVSLTSALNGYFTAIRQVAKNSVTVFLEQGIRIFLSVLLISSVLPSGIEYACIALALGTTVSEAVSLLVMTVLYIFKKNKENSSCQGPIRKTLLEITLPVAFSSYARSGLLTLEHALIPIGLKKFGAGSASSLALYGTLHSMAFPTVLFPAVFITSFSGLLIPELAESRAVKNKKRIKRIVRKTLYLTLLFSIGVGGIMFCFADRIGTLLYPDAPEAGEFIRMLSPLIPAMYIDSMTDAMLKGLGKQFYSMTVNIVDSILSVVLVWLLLPKMGVEGYVLTVYICEVINVTLSLIKLLTVSHYRPSIIRLITKPLVAVIGAVSITRLVSLLGNGDVNYLSVGWTLLCAALVYLLLLLGLFAVKMPIRNAKRFTSHI